uniref:DDE Tnp4 domain-containing protein n=1 Tax=Lactuca sativa TaxID=4236 RepID=A0A9R1XN27_LACSA|nr:hypothetical protein LSAT_V11C300104770 [Lactuca sativa]
MNRVTFVKLCRMVEIDGKLKASRYLQIDEQVAIFLYVLAHHVKNRVAKFQFRRSGETISKHFNNVLNVVIRLEKELFKKPEPISETSTDERWKWFKGCLGAIDGTHISVHVPEADKPRYRNQKGEITTNVLAACTPDMQFIYVLPGWEGSAADGRILRSAMLRENGLQVSKGNYYLVDVGYTNGEGFLASFRGQRYHLNTWLNGHRTEKAEEYFNMKHSAARNVIERMESQIHGDRGPGKNKKKWNDIEDEKLVEAMVDILNSGSHFKSDNGFKPEFFGAVETRLAVSLPNSGIKAKPHIESRIKTLKSDWSTVHKNAAKWRGKKFPHYWDLCLVFGKDRANGRDAQTTADVISEINNEQQEPDDYIPTYTHSKEDSSIQRKRKRRNSWDPLMNNLKDSTDIIGSKIDNATSTFNVVFGIERDREELRKKLNSEMKKVVGLTVRDCNKAVHMLSKNDELMVIFFTVEEEDKFEWVKDLLEDDV